MEATLYEKGEGGLTEKQKTLPKKLQEAILKKQGESPEESEAKKHDEKEKKKKLKSIAILGNNGGKAKRLSLIHI